MSGGASLLDGPRGRRFLMELAKASEPLDGDALGPFGMAVFETAYHLDPGAGTTRVVFGPDAPGILERGADPARVAAALDAVRLAEPTPTVLRTALAAAVDTARYWQEPDGEDVLAAHPALRDGLARVAEHVAAASTVAWWSEPPALTDQWAVLGDDPPTDLPSHLAEWRAETEASERRAARERPVDPTASWSGEWWSFPPSGLRRSARRLEDGSPALLWFREDNFGEEELTVAPIAVPTSPRVFEVTGPESWAALCRIGSVEVTAQKRHDWFRTTGRDGRWVVPDWSQVFTAYDAVHLTVAGYLTAAGTTIPVDASDGPEGSASVIAGWNPDETVWAAPTTTGEPTRWRQTDDEAGVAWQRADPGQGRSTAVGLG